jgi:hypothetical protein
MLSPLLPRASRPATSVPPAIARRFHEQVQIAKVDATGVHIDEPIVLKGEWDHARFVDGSSKSGDGGW